MKTHFGGDGYLLKLDFDHDYVTTNLLKQLQTVYLQWLNVWYANYILIQWQKMLTVPASE